MKSSITGKTKLISLLGFPVSHSKSPSMQNGVFEALGLDYVYMAFDVGLSDVEAAVEGLRVMNFRGSNVTMQLKKEICKYLDKLTPAAEMAGAVNVIVNNDGVLTGKDEFYTNGEKTVAGLRDRFDCDAHMFDLADMDKLRKEMASSDIFINGTPVGMQETIDQAVIPDASYFHPSLIVTYLIYVPVETKLLKLAKDAGNKTVSGLGMQLFQGVSAFKMWTGHDMPIDIAREILFGSPAASSARLI